MDRSIWCQLVVALFAVGLAAACGGQDRDRPQDCRSSEFFNESTKRCQACPAVTPPDCPEGCGWEVFERDNGCAAARCAPDCRFCELGQRYSEEDGLCEPCPGVPNCDELACEGELRSEGTQPGPCPEDPSAFACGECSDPKGGCAVEDGKCVDPDESSDE